MTTGYAELASQGGAVLQSSEWLLWQLLQAEIEDRHIRSIRCQLQSARFPVHRDLAGFDFEQAKVDRVLVEQLGGCFIDAAHKVVLVAAPVPAKPIWPPLWVSKPLPTTASASVFIRPSILSRNWGGRRPLATKAN